MKRDPSMLPTGERIGERYVILDLIGAGAMGVVYRARHERLHRDVAVKVLTVPPDPDVVHQFEREGIALAALRHPSIVDVYDAGEADGIAWIAMELLVGETLGDAIRRTGGLDALEVASIGRAIASAIAAAHDVGILHRDLKPENVFLVHDKSSRARAKVVDFGVASISGDRATDLVGTPLYLAPEVMKLKGAARPTDVWALGVTLFEALTGDPPFNASNLSRLAADIMSGNTRDIRSVRNVPDWLADPVMACLRRNPADRPTAAALVDMLRPTPALDDTLSSGDRLSDVVGSFRTLASRTNLPEATDPLVGRSEEIARVRNTIATARLVTLLGPGGTGKTRLAIEAARAEVPNAAGGVWFCDLTNARSADDLLSAVARAIELPLVHGVAPESAVSRALAARGGCLLVLDNFEGLVPFSSHIVEWLSGAPALRIVVTSRSMLHVRGEHVIDVPPLGNDEALQLLSLRAEATGAPLREADMTHAAEIVAKLEGIPLAIELAAARLGAISVKQLAQRLSEPLRVLSVQHRGPPSRRSTLRSVIEDSWSALDADERSTLAHCSVFVGGWSLEAAEAIIDEPSRTLLDILEALKNQSMIRAKRGEGDIRFSMLETIREFAAERLENETTIRDRHARYVIGWAERVTSFDPPIENRRQLQVETENVLAAVDWLMPKDGISAACGLLALEPLLNQSNPRLLLERIDRLQNLDEITRLRIDMACARARAVERPLVSAGELAKLAAHAGRLDRVDLRQRALLHAVEADAARNALAQAEERLAEGLALPGTLGPPLRGQRAINRWRSGLFEEALRDAEETALDPTSGPAVQLNARITASIVALQMGEHEAAHAHADAALALALAIDHKRAEGSILNNHALVHADEGNLPSAESLLRRGLIHNRQIGNLVLEGIVLGNLGVVHVLMKENAMARNELSGAVRILTEVGDKRFRGWYLGWLSGLAALEGRLELAERQWSEASAFARDVADARLMTALDVVRLHIDLAQGAAPGSVTKTLEDAQKIRSEYVRFATRWLHSTLPAN